MGYVSNSWIPTHVPENPVQSEKFTILCKYLGSGSSWRFESILRVTNNMKFSALPVGAGLDFPFSIYDTFPNFEKFSEFSGFLEKYYEFF